MKYSNVLVFGMAKSGFAAAKLLKSKRIKYSLHDYKSIDVLNMSDENTEVIKSASKTFFGRNMTLQELLEFDLIVISPSVAYNLKILIEARKQGIEVIGELELGYMYSHGKIVAITGTNGKTTTTNIVNSIFKTAGYDSRMVGNVGVPLCEEILKSDSEDTVYVCEVSSYQLESVKHFKADVALITNVTPDHLERHTTMQNYIATKLKIVDNMNSDNLFVCRSEDFAIYDDISNGKINCINKIEISVNNKNAEFYCDSGIIYKNNTLETKEALFDSSNLKILGVHNIENVLFSIAVARSFGINQNTINKALSEFKGVSHRLELIDIYDEINFFNDSKATNPESAIIALDSIHTPVIVLAGGSYKDVDYTKWAMKVKKAKHIFLYGDTRFEIEKVLNKCNVVNYSIRDNLNEVFDDAVKIANSGDSILLSPACASFDQYDNFEKRGEHFCKLVRDYINSKNWEKSCKKDVQK